MPTADELRAGISGGRAALKAAIAASAGNWEVAKGTADDGEAGWSPRQVAEHVIPAEMMFANNICKACDYEGPTSPLGKNPQFASADDAIAALDATQAAFNSKVNYVQDEELGKSAGGEGMGAAPVSALMTMATWHLADHAAQMITPS